MLSMMLVLAFMYTVCMSIKTLVLEKEMRLKEVLRAMGIRNGALWAARFTENLALLAVPCALISVMVKVSRGGSPGGSDTKHSMGNDRRCVRCGVLLPLVARMRIARIEIFSSAFNANAS